MFLYENSLTLTNGSAILYFTFLLYFLFFLTFEVNPQALVLIVLFLILFIFI